jgi:hypothetical protein
MIEAGGTGPVSLRRTGSGDAATRGGEPVREAMKRRAAAQRAAAKVMREEMERAERYMHSVGQATFEVIDAAAVEEAIRVVEP